MEVKGRSLHDSIISWRNSLQFTEIKEVDWPVVVFGGIKTPEALLNFHSIWTVKLSEPTTNMLEARLVFKNDERRRHRCSFCGAAGVTMVSATNFEEKDDFGSGTSIGGSNYSCTDPEHLNYTRGITGGITVTEHPVHTEVW